MNVVQGDRSAVEQARRRRARVAWLEADLAYFQARLELIGEPGSANQRAQRKVFKLLHQHLGTKLARARSAA